MKKPDEIKKGLEYCGNSNNCSYACPYRADCLFGDSRALEHDALTYIQQLERERDAMLASMKEDPHCCFHCNGIGCTTRKAKGNGNCFEWRSVEEADHAQTD